MFACFVCDLSRGVVCSVVFVSASCDGVVCLCAAVCCCLVCVCVYFCVVLRVFCVACVRVVLV